MIVILPLMIFIIVGLLASIILFIIGIVRGLIKKKWKLAIFSVILFIFVIVVYSLSQSYYRKYVEPKVIRDLQNNVIPLHSP